MLSTHVNLCDMLDYANEGEKIEKFTSVEELRVYTLNTGKVFPREEAYAGGLLKFLLREITGKYKGRRGKAGGRKKKRAR